MIRGLTVENGAVANIAKFNTVDDLFDGWQVAAEGVAIGDVDNGDGTFSKPQVEQTEAEQLAAAKQAARQRIDTAKLAAQEGGIDHVGHRWDTDSRSQALLTGAIVSVNAGIPLPGGFEWTSADDTDVPMDGPALVALGAAVMAHVNTRHAKARALKKQIDAVELTTTLEDAIAQIDAIVWE